jgi:hypothetical protein
MFHLERYTVAELKAMVRNYRKHPVASWLLRAEIRMACCELRKQRLNLPHLVI